MKYVNFARDHDELLYFTLNKIVKEKIRFQQLKNKVAPEVVEVDMEDFESRVSCCLFTMLFFLYVALVIKWLINLLKAHPFK